MLVQQNSELTIKSPLPEQQSLFYTSTHTIITVLSNTSFGLLHLAVGSLSQPLIPNCQNTTCASKKYATYFYENFDNSWPMFISFSLLNLERFMEEAVFKTATSPQIVATLPRKT